MEYQITHIRLSSNQISTKKISHVKLSNGKIETLISIIANVDKGNSYYYRSFGFYKTYIEVIRTNEKAPYICSKNSITIRDNLLNIPRF